MSVETKSQGAPKTAGGGNRVRAGSNVLISLIGAAAILLAVNYLGMRHYIRADWTKSGLYTLSDKSIKMLRTLDREVQLYVLWSQSDRRFLDVKELIDRYLAASKRLKLELLDQDLNPDRVKMIIDRYGAKLRDMGGGMVAIEASIIVVSGDNVKFVSSQDFESFNEGDGFGPDQESGEALSGFRAEQALSSAILSVTSGKQPKVCFTQGHGEWLFEGFGGRALGHIKEALLQDGYKVEPITTFGASRIPEGCDLVVVAAPQNAFLEEEAAILKRYLTRGGRAALLLDPVIEETRFKPTGLEPLAADFGIKLSQDLILEVDPKRLVSPSPFTFTASEFSEHKAVSQLVIPDSAGDQVKKEIGVYPVVFSTVRSLLPREGAEATAEVLAKSSKESWGEVDLASMGEGGSVPSKDQYDTPGPANLAMAASLEGGGRLVVVGDADFLTNDLFVNAGLRNQDFWSGLLGWLTQRSELISIAPKNPEHVRLNLTDQDRSTIQQVLAGEVVLFILLGVFVWMRRRR